jgi:hypothetical protein
VHGGLGTADDPGQFIKTHATRLSR